MPGIIQVSVVLNLMDLPKPEASINVFTLKVAMGKREYQQNMGQGDCLVPVMSLRENLNIVILDVEGKELFRSEFKAISVVEKGILEDSYPLASGGYVHMKLHFLLSQEENKRIREVREFALRKKRREQPNTEIKAYNVAGQKNGTPSKYAASRGALRGQPQKTDPIQVLTSTHQTRHTSSTASQTSSSLPLFHQLASKSSGSSSNIILQVIGQPAEQPLKRDAIQLSEASQENVKVQSPVDGISKWKITSGGGLNYRSDYSRSSISGNATKNSYSDTVELKENQIRSNVRKMAKTFTGTNKMQEPETHFGHKMKSLASKVEMEGSLKRVSSVERDISNINVSHTISKSFSSGMLFDADSQQNPRSLRPVSYNKQDEQEVCPAKRWETMVKNTSSLGYKNEKNLKNQDPEEPTGSIKTILSKRAINSVRFTEHVSENEGPAPIVLENDSSVSSLKSDVKESQQNLNTCLFSKDRKILESKVSGAMDAMPSGQYGEELEGSFKDEPFGEGSSNRGTIDGNSGNFEQNSVKYPGDTNVEATHIKEKKTEEHTSVIKTLSSREKLDESVRKDQLQHLNLYRQGSSSTEIKEKRSDCSRSHSDETESAAPSEMAETLINHDHIKERSWENDGLLGTRQLCITTGPRQLRDLVKCTNCEGKHLLQEGPPIGSDDQKKPQDESSIQASKKENSFTSTKPDPENSAGISKSFGGVIEQGVRIAILLVACGILLFNTRQRKPKKGNRRE